MLAFHYGVCSQLARHNQRWVRCELSHLQIEADATPAWGDAMPEALTAGYLGADGIADILPRSAPDRDHLLAALVQAQALWQVGYRLRRRDNEIGIALRVLETLLNG